MGAIVGGGSLYGRSVLDPNASQLVQTSQFIRDLHNGTTGATKSSSLDRSSNLEPINFKKEESAGVLIGDRLSVSRSIDQFNYIGRRASAT